MSVVIPARDEEACLGRVLRITANSLASANIPYELVVVDDHSTDNTRAVVRRYSSGNEQIRLHVNGLDPGFGNAVDWGIRQASGDIVVVMMADGSDRPADLIRYYDAFDEGVDCVFGSRFEDKSRLIGYPQFKLILNRLGNALVRSLFDYPYRDITNAFKAYRLGVLKNAVPLKSSGFEATLELPLRVLEAGATVKEIPVTWKERSTGISKMNLLRDVWRYLVLLFRCRFSG